MNDEALELVTAYVDGEATADERAHVEADAELLAEAELQREARAALHDVDPPSHAVRESAIAAALSVFDNEVAGRIRPPASSSTPDVTAPTNIVPFEQRRRMRWMQSVGAAAAIVAVVVAGAVIATRGGDDGSTANEARDNTDLSIVDGTTDEDGTVRPPPAAEVASSDPSVMMAVPATDQPLADEASAADAEAPAASSVSEYEDNAAAVGAPAGATPTTVAPAPSAPAMPAPAAATQRLKIVTTDDNLREFADALDTPPLDVAAAETECADGALEPDATFEDEGGQREIVVVAIDDDTIGALALDGCEVVLEADLDPGP